MVRAGQATEQLATRNPQVELIVAMMEVASCELRVANETLVNLVKDVTYENFPGQGLSITEQDPVHDAFLKDIRIRGIIGDGSCHSQQYGWCAGIDLGPKDVAALPRS